MDDELRDLPPDLRDAAFRSRNGEWAWPRLNAVAVARWLSAHGWAVLGGETWQPQDDGGVRIPYFWGWSIDGRDGDETWPHYCDRAADLADGALSTDALEHETEHSGLFYNLTFCTESEYEALKASSTRQS